MIKEAKKRAKEEGVKIKFKIGDMRALPYNDNSFDVILVMWAAFIELHKKKDQIKALKEMLRVLRKKGFALLEMPYMRTRKTHLKIKDDEYTIKGKIIHAKFSGLETMPLYIHTKTSLRELAKELKLKKYKIFVDNFGGRERLFLQFWK